MAVPAFVDASTGWFRMSTQGGGACASSAPRGRPAAFPLHDSAGFTAPDPSSISADLFDKNFGLDIQTNGLSRPLP